MLPPKNLAFLSVGGNFKFFLGGGGEFPPPPLNTPEQNLLHATAISDRIFQVIFILPYMADQLKIYLKYPGEILLTMFSFLSRLFCSM